MSNPKEKYYIFDLTTKRRSRKFWKTYKGALKHAKKNQIVSTKTEIEWLLRRPEYDRTRPLPESEKNENRID